MKILMLGDVNGGPGRRMLKAHVKRLKAELGLAAVPALAKHSQLKIHLARHSDALRGDNVPGLELRPVVQAVHGDKGLVYNLAQPARKH